MELELNEKIVIKGRTRTVTPAAFEALPRARARLVEVARAGTTTTYGDLIRDAGLPYAVQALGRFLDLVAEDCDRRGEPPLDALVVAKSTGEVGSEHGSDAVQERRDVHRHWSR